MDTDEGAIKEASNVPAVSRLLTLLVCLVASGEATKRCAEAQGVASSTEVSPSLDSPRPIGGRWFVVATNPPKYLYKDAHRLVDLFEYHRRDSNHDGIDNVRLGHDMNFLRVASQGYPNHPTAVFPNSRNPNSIRVQDFHFQLPLEPIRSMVITRLPMGPIGMAINGVVFFNPFEAGGMNAVEGYSEVWLDSCCGHPQQHGVYHYHKFPSCVKSPFPDEGKEHSPIIGFAFDGYPIHGPYERDGVLAKDVRGKDALDACNGHSDPERGYHYHVTPGQFPYIIGGYRGVVEPENNHMLARGDEGAIKDNARGKSPLRDALVIKPKTVERGGKHILSIRVNRRVLPTALGGQTPTWVQFGPYEAHHIERRGDKILAEIDVPADADLGIPLDCHLELEIPGGELPVVIKENDAIRIVE